MLRGIFSALPALQRGADILSLRMFTERLSDMTTSMVELNAKDGNVFLAYLAKPQNPIGPGIVVLQEIFGVNANIRSIVDGFAENGYIAIAPDLFWRLQPNVELDPSNPQHREQASQLLKAFDTASAAEDALIAADYIRKLAGASGRIGAVGYCLGGKLSYLLATKAGIDAAVSYYGVAIQSALDEVPNLKAKLLLHIAREDHLCPALAQEAIRTAMAPCNNRVTIMEYDGVGHAFARSGGSSYDAASAKRADEATLEFLAGELSGRE
jgi:carboxymethylenebutenolidase